jgi:hypothetical protein
VKHHFAGSETRLAHGWNTGKAALTWQRPALKIIVRAKYSLPKRSLPKCFLMDGLMIQVMTGARVPIADESRPQRAMLLQRRPARPARMRGVPGSACATLAPSPALG